MLGVTGTADGRGGTLPISRVISSKRSGLVPELRFNVGMSIRKKNVKFQPAEVVSLSGENLIISNLTHSE